MSEVETRVKLRIRRYGAIGADLRNLLEILEANGWSVEVLSASEGPVVTFMRGDGA